MQKVLIEVAVLTLSAADHDSLHRDPKVFVNSKKVFRKAVTSMYLPSHPPLHRKNATYTVTMSHWPDCNAMGKYQLQIR